MKFNKWTLGLAAVGVVSLASAAKADEKISRIQTAMSSTTISGYVDTSAQWNFGTGNTFMPPYSFGGSGKADGFNLNVVQVSISQPLDESEWASGYKVDLWMGPDAAALATQSVGGGEDFAIRQAYVALRTPLGNGIDWKVGVFDTIIGYESIESGINPNFTRSYGHTLEPTTHTGVLGTYRFCDEIAVSAGVADTVGPTINGRAHTVGVAGGGNQAESYKTYMASVALTAPESMGFLAGSTLYAGVINGFSGGSGLAAAGTVNGAGNITSWYVGGTVATPVAGLKLGIAYDYYDSHRGSATTTVPPTIDGRDASAIGLYASYQATEKLSFHTRGELVTSASEVPGSGKDNAQIWAFTATAQYDLWQNVISRIEFRWDHADEGDYFGAANTPVPPATVGSPTRRNAYMLAANIIYKF